MSQKFQNLLCAGYCMFISFFGVGMLLRTLLAAVQGDLFFHRTPRGFAFIDFVAFYSCGKLVLSDLRHNLYDASTQLSFFNATLSPWRVEHFPMGQSVPWYMLFLAPFATMPLLAAFVLWTVLALVATVFGLCLLSGFEKQSRKFLVFFLLGLFGSYPFQWLLHDGQNAWMLLLFASVFLYGWFAKRDLLAGIALGLLTIKPQYALILGIITLASGRWRIAGTSVATLLVLLAASAGAFGVDALLKYPAVLQATERADIAVFPAWMVSIRGPLSMVIPVPAAMTITFVIYCATAAALFVFWFKVARKAREKEQKVAFIITFLAVVLTSPHTHVYDLPIVAAPLLISLPSLNWFDAVKYGSRATLWCRSVILYPVVGLLVFLATEVIVRGEVVGIAFFSFNCWLLLCAAAYFRALAENRELVAD